MGADLGFRRCLADRDLMAGSHEALAAGYDWMLDGDSVADGGRGKPARDGAAAERIGRASALL